MPLTPVMTAIGIPIDINECIGDSLYTINAAFTALDFRTSSLTPPTTSGNVFLTTISGGNILIGGPNVTTTISGNSIITGNLTLSGNAYFSQNIFVSGAVVASLLSSTGDLYVDGNGYIGGDLTVLGKITGSELSSTGDLTVDGDTWLKGNLDVLGDARIHGKLTASELSSTGPLTVDGDTTLKGNLSVWGNSFLGDQCSDFTQIQGTLKLPCVNTQNAIEFNRETTFTGIPVRDGAVVRYETDYFNLNEDALIFEKTDQNQNPVAGGIAFISRGNLANPPDQSLIIRGDGKIGMGTMYPNKDLTVIGEISATHNVHFNKNLQVDGNTTLGDGGDTTTIKDHLNVNGNTQMSGDLIVLGDLTVLGETTQLDTEVNITSAVDITNHGTTTALTVNQTGNNPVAHFKDDNNTALYISGNPGAPGWTGLGTMNPTARLEVNGDIALSVANGGSREIRIPTVPANSTDLKINATNNIILQETNGNVAIGRAVPVTTLDVNGDVTITDKIIHSSDTNTCIRFPVDDNFAIETQGLDRFRVLANGNVGINQTIPAEKLHVVGNVKFEGVQEIISNSPNPALRIVQDGSGYALRVDDVTGDTTPFVIDSDGNVGIKTSSCNSALDVNGDVTITDKIIHSVDPNTCIRFPVDDNFAIETQGLDRVRVIANGYVGINQTVPTERLEVNGNIQLTVPGSPNPNYRMMGLREALRNDILIGTTYDDDPVTLVTLRKFLFDEGSSLTVAGNFILTNADHNRTYVCTNSAPINITCPSGLKVGLQVSFIRGGTGEVTFINGAGTTLNSALNFTKLAFTNSAGTVYLGQTNTYYLFGDLLP